MSLDFARTLRRTLASIRFVLQRLRASWALSSAVVVGIAALVSVWVGIPLYAESASSRLLSTEVNEAADDGVPFGYLFSYNRLSGGNRTWSDFAPLSELIEGEDAPFGSTVRAQQRLLTTIPFELATKEATDGRGERTTLDSVAFVSMSEFEALAELTIGTVASPATSTDSAVEVVVDSEFAELNGLTVGQEYRIVNRRAPVDDPQRAFDVRVSGIWQPPSNESAADASTRADPTLRYLVNGSMTGRLIVPESTIQSVIDPLTEASLSNAQWLVLLDSSTVTTDSVSELLANTTRISRQVDDRLRGARILVSPESSLEGFQQDVADLNRGLSLFSLPTLALVLAVLVLVVSLRWQRRHDEVRLLRRRGVPASQIMAETAGEAVLLTAAGAAAGWLGARAVATFMGRTTTFLQLGDGVDLSLLMNSRSWRALTVAIVISIAIVIAPSFNALRDRVLTVSGTENGADRQPWWQRSKLDVVGVAAVAFLSWFLLRRETLQSDLLDDPVVILLPALAALAAGLLALRLLPTLAHALTRVLERTDSSAGLLVARRTARVPRPLTAPILLLVITAALAIYTGSLARTLDLQLLDAAHHRVGAQNNVRSTIDNQLGERFALTEDGVERLASGGPAIEPDSFSKIWGVSAASRFATLPARLLASTGTTTPVMFLGIDTETFGGLAFWRSDYASRPLPQLMAQLQATPDSVLVNTATMRTANLQIGDFVTVAVRNAERVQNLEMVVVGTFDQFPTWIPGPDVLPPIVGSLSDFEARSGTSVARELLYESDDRTSDLAQTRADFSRLGTVAGTPSNPETIIERVQRRPARQGVFGLLTVSFALSVGLSVLAFVFYAVFGFRRQMTELGVLRALGLPAGGLMKLVALDLALVAITGVGVGALAGLALARWYLPQLVDPPLAGAPNLLQEIDWSAAVGIPLILAVTLALAAFFLILGLRRIRLFEAIKVGEGS